jgi:DNA mismatch repair protein MSH6
LQTETPDQLKERNERRKAAGQKQDKVVTRDKVAVLTRGTLTDAEMVRPAAGHAMCTQRRISCFGGGGGAGGRLQRVCRAMQGRAV